MWAISKEMLSLQSFRSASIFPNCVVGCLSLFAFALPAASLRAQDAVEVSALGVAWKVQGTWQIDGKGAPILTGDAIQPGSLLRPGEETANHSISVFLPDGQSILYECSTATDCARGFRVPPLDLKPEPFAVDMLARIRATLLRENHDPPGPGSHLARPLPRDEVVAALDSNNRVQVAGLLAAKLPNGRYTCDVWRLDGANPHPSRLVLEKNGPTIPVALPSAGLYMLAIADDQNKPRIDLFVAAVNSAQAATSTKSFIDAKKQLRSWIESYYGWPIHAFQWAYLESLVSDAQPPSTGVRVAGAASDSSGESHVVDGGRTAEPVFSPQPGWLNGDAAITLRCDTSGATMHYTVDLSTPVAGSPVYGAPIMAKAEGLTIMAFASAPGKKDSAVVTGNFRIRR
jgi:hypothetical protein